MAGDTDNQAGSLREAVIEAIKLGEGQFGKREIARALKLKGTDAKRALKDALNALEDEGAIKRTNSKTYTLAGALPSVTVVEIVDRDTDGELLAEPVRADHEAPRIRLAPGEGAGGKGQTALGIGDKALVRLTPTRRAAMRRASSSASDRAPTSCSACSASRNPDRFAWCPSTAARATSSFRPGAKRRRRTTATSCSASWSGNAATG